MAVQTPTHHGVSLKKCFILILIMDRVILEKLLPGELASLIMEYRFRDREVKSPTAALIREALLDYWAFHVPWEEIPFLFLPALLVYLCYHLRNRLRGMPFCLPV